MDSLVSILIPCYNARDWIGQAIESAIAQTWEDKEIIVVDDGSTDGSLEVIRLYRHQISFESGPNRAGGYARNRLLHLANGHWLQYLDADDYLLPEKIESQMRFIRSHSDVDVVFGPVTAEYCDFQETRRELLTIPEQHDLWVLLASWVLPQTGAPLWRRQALIDVGGWKRDQPCCQEHELYSRLLMAEKRFSFCPTNGAIYRLWSDDTLCKRDVGEVHRRRLEIEQRTEDYLRSRRELTPGRLKAINQARFEIARSAWAYDRHLAKNLIDQVKRLDPSFLPSGPAAPFHYALAFRTLGFSQAEKLAGAVRKLTS